MARTPSIMVDLGTKAPTFKLPDTDGKLVSLESFAGKPGLLVMFISNHCPFVKWLRPELAKATSQFIKDNLGVVAIMSNDVINYPDDSPEKMREEVKSTGYQFPYLYDESQAVARAYQAACTPDFFLFDKDFRLVYRGQFDDSRPESDIPVTGKDLRAAVEKLLRGEAIPEDQRPSLGCNIKWK